MIRYDFRFEQEGRVVYLGDQSAMFLKEPDAGKLAAPEGADG